MINWAWWWKIKILKNCIRTVKYVVGSVASNFPLHSFQWYIFWSNLAIISHKYARYLIITTSKLKYIVSWLSSHPWKIKYKKQTELWLLHSVHHFPQQINLETPISMKVTIHLSIFLVTTEYSKFISVIKSALESSFKISPNITFDCFNCNAI